MIAQHRVAKIVLIVTAAFAVADQASAVTNGIVSGGVDSVDGVVFNAATGANPLIDQNNNFLAIVVGSNYDGYSATIGNPPEGIPPGTAAQLQVNSNSVVMNRDTYIQNGGRLVVNNASGINEINSSNATNLSGSNANVGLSNNNATIGVGSGAAFHGLTVTGGATASAKTTLTGGTNSSSLTLQDSQATLAVGTATTTETNAIVVTGTASGATTNTAVSIGGANNTSTTITSGSNSMTASVGMNTLSGQTGNSISAVTGSNQFSANGTNGSNVIQATGTGGSNVVNAATNLMANASTYAGATSAVQTSATGVDIKGGVINMGTTGTNTVNIGNSSGTTTLNFNNNRLQNVAPGIVGTDAVNLNQLKAVQNWAQNAINSNSQGIAGVAAATNLPGLNGNQKYNMGIAWGNYQTFNGVAIGGHARVSDNVTLKLSGSNSGNVYSGGVGLGIGF